MKPLSLLLLLILPAGSVAQAWSGIIDPSRAMDWSNAGIPGGIPNATVICRSVPPSQDTTGATDGGLINQALVACSGTSQVQVVQLEAGTYTFNAGLLFNGSSHFTAALSNVVLRGAGPDKTILIFKGQNGCNGAWSVICMNGNPGWNGAYITHGGSAGWTGDSGVSSSYARGDSVIDVGTWTGNVPAVGDIIHLDQRNDSIGICPGGTVTTASWTSGTATLTLGTAPPGPTHTFASGQSVTVSGVNPSGFNGTYTLTAANPGGDTTAGTISYPLAMSPGAWVAGGLVTGTVAPCASIAGATESGTTVTITTSMPHGYSVGQCVGTGDIGGQIKVGTIPNAYNSGANRANSCTGSNGVTFSGWFPITAVPSNTTFQYTAPASGLSPNGNGNVTADTGGTFVSDTNNATTNEWVSQGRKCPDSNNVQCLQGEFSWRSQNEIKRITACNGSSTPGTSCTGATTLTIDPPLEMGNWRSALNPGVWWTGKHTLVVGIENLTYDMTKSGAGTAGGGINISNSYECWVKNVRGINGARNHVWISNSARMEVVDSYFFGTMKGASESYGVETLTSSDDLIQNNICHHIVACMMNGQDYGAVFGYNYSVDGGGTAATFLSGGLAFNHDLASLNLFEGNDTTNGISDNIHGTSVANTLFRNRIRAQDTPLKIRSLFSVAVDSFNRAHNVIGSVFGTSSTQTPNYQNTSTTGWCCSSGYIYYLGVQAEGGKVTPDSIALSSLFRWGNYDVATAAKSGNPTGVRWCGNSSSPNWTTVCGSTSEVPTAGIPFIKGNPVPSSTYLPASFYLSAQPLFWQTAWGTPGWPAIGPDVIATGALNTTCTPDPMHPTLCDGVATMSYQIPAQICYNNTPVDQSYQETYSITQADWKPNFVTLTIPTSTFKVGDVITLSGASPAGFNGIYPICGPAYTPGCPTVTTTTVSYYLANSPGTWVSGGILTWPNIRLYNATSCYPNAYSQTPPAPTVVPRVTAAPGTIVGQRTIH